MALPSVEDEDGVRWIRFDRPEVLNALHVEDLDLVAAAVREPAPGVRAIVLTGAGDRAFSSGMHKDTFANGTPASGRAIISAIGASLEAVRRCPVPTLAMVNGYCLGAAFEMILSCDLRVAHPDAKVGLPEVKLGIPSVLDAALLRHYVGLSKAKEMILTGDLYAVTELEQTGLFNGIVAVPNLRAEALRFLDKLSPLTLEVISAQKGLFETWMNTGLEQSVRASIDVFGEIFESTVTLEALDRYRATPPSSR